MSRSAAASVLLAAALGALAAVPSPTPSGAAAAVRAAESSYAAYLEREDLELRMRRGLPIEALPDLSLAKAERDGAFGRTLAGSLASVRGADLPHEDELTLEILRREAAVLVDRPGRYWLTFPMTPYTFQFLGVHPAFTQHPFRDAADADRYEKLLARYPEFIRSIEARLREQARHGIVLPGPEIPLVAGVFAPAGAEKEKNLFRVAPSRLGRLAPADREAFAGRVASRIEGEIRPAVRSLVAYLTGEYSSQAPGAVGLGQYPGGADYYRRLVRQSTTLDVTPEEIHRIGIESMAKINAELDAIRRKLGFPGTLAEFRDSLKRDRRFYAKSADETGARLMAAQNRILPKLPAFFGRQPKAPFGVARLEAQLEGALTFGYYQVPTPADPKGYYKYNGTHLDERSLIGAGSLISHELMPGHHMQFNLQYENAGLSPFRRESVFYTAFVEGWGDYASFLAGEMGMYADPYDLCGRLLFDAFLTSRLVVDTGMNVLGWSRERAMAYMRENTIQSETEIATETLRYACDLPAQALAYKMGMRHFVSLRDKARAALGPKFDMPRYHDMILSSGAVPLDLAARKVDWFIHARGVR
ncbi:MAG: DUF885 domain-containing protein [Acidobacteriota bacterium]